MKVVLDANIVVAAFGARGICQSVFEFCLLRHEIVIGEILMGEIFRALKRKLKVPPQIVDEVRYLLESCARIESPAPVAEGSCRDPGDNHVLGLAAAAQADFIVTGDGDLLSLKSYDGIPIVTPREFWEHLRKQK